MRYVAALHDLALAILTGCLAGVFLVVNTLFERAPSREIAGQVGNAIFSRIGPSALALAAILLAARLALHRVERPTARRLGALVLTVAIAATVAMAALYLTPRMSALWASAPHAADGSGLAGEAKGRFLTMHIVSGVAYLIALLSGCALVILRAVRTETIP